jgi:hypothetical protein
MTASAISAGPHAVLGALGGGGLIAYAGLAWYRDARRPRWPYTSPRHGRPRRHPLRQLIDLSADCGDAPRKESGHGD